jgi:hypothetical protein
LNASARYTSAAGAQPLDVLLFFSTTSAGQSFSVSGTFSTTPGGPTGSITGALVPATASAIVAVQAVTPPTGTFQGVVTTNDAGCESSKNYSGTITTSGLNWTAGSDVSTCPNPTPLSFNIAAQSAPFAPALPASGTYSGSFSVTMLLNETSAFTGELTGCIRADTVAATLTMRLTVANDGSVTGTAHAIGTETVTALTQTDSRFKCDGGGDANTVGHSGHFETANDGDMIVHGTTSNFGFVDAQTVKLPVGNVAFTNTFTGAFSGNTVVGIFKSEENLMPGGYGAGSSNLTLTR